MFLLRYSVTPAQDHAEQDRLGESLVCCWIDRPSLEEADDVARRDITELHWVIIERESAETPSVEEYEDEEFRVCHEQAMIDGEVYRYHLSPRYPVYWVAASVAQGEEVAEAHYFLCGDAIRGEDEDVYDPAFWTSDRLAAALTGAREAISSQEWSLESILAQRPCGRSDVPEDLLFAYDEAEDAGACLVFVHNEEEEERAED